MILYIHQIIIILLFLLLSASSAQNVNSTDCNQTCGEEHVQYPFGFSEGCEIRLNCSAKTQIGGFAVQNFTSDSILITLPAKCDRPIEELSGLFGLNFAPTWRNGFLLENCSSTLNDCVIPSRLIRSQVNNTCEFGGKLKTNDRFNISCYSEGLDNPTVLDYQKVVSNKGNCNVLYSSLMVDLNRSISGGGGGSSIALEFETVELEWWVNGECNCDRNSTCNEVVRGGRKGFRCKCGEGFAGDGFAGGEGCQRVFECNGASRYMSRRCGGTKVGIIVGGTIAGVSFLSALALIFYCIKRRSASLNTRLSAKHLLSEAAANYSVPFHHFKEIERATNNFSDKQRLGTGAYGTVYAGKLHSNELVAIKKIRYRDHDTIDQVMNEIKLLSSVNHPNLVRLLGCCIENKEQILVYEYMPNGTLSQHLQRERGSVLPWTTRLTIAVETAQAIAHLHSAMIYHRDVKSSNILLDYNFNSKVADFGLSRFGMAEDFSHISTAPQGTPGYLDPQYHQNFHLSDKSDVYSFGVVLVEIITAMKAVDFSRPQSEVNLAALAVDRIGKGRVDEIIDPFLEPNRDAWTLSSVHKLAEMAFRCLAFHRDMRPSMMEVAEELEQIRLSGWAPMDENMCMNSSVGSTCSSPYIGSEKSFSVKEKKKSGVVGMVSRRLVVPPTRAAEEAAKDQSPVSVHDSWLSEQSSPSGNSLLGNVVR